MHSGFASASLRSSIHSLRIRMTSYPCNKYEQITPSYLLSVNYCSLSIWNCLPSESFRFQLLYSHEWSDFAARSGYTCVRTRNILFTCKPCLPGHFLLIKERSCSMCPPGGFYQDQLAQIKCKRCPLGQYVPPEKAPGKNPLECTTCPERTRTNESAGYRACKCLNGFFRKHRFGGCVKCETQGIQCEGDYQTLAPDFWWSWDYSVACFRKYLAFVDNLKLQDNTYNRNSWSFDCPIPKSHRCPSKGICLGGIRSQCRKGYIGPLCALCKKGHYRQFKSCTECPEVWIVGLQLLVYILIFILLCVLVNWADKLTVNLSKAEDRSLADVLLSMLKILLGFYQVLNEIITSFSYTSWPKTLRAAIKVFSYVQLELLRLPSLWKYQVNPRGSPPGIGWGIYQFSVPEG